MWNGINMTTASSSKDAFLPLYFTLVGSHLNNCVHFGAPHCKKGIGTLEKIQQKTPRCSEAVAHEIKGEAETAGSLQP